MQCKRKIQPMRVEINNGDSLCSKRTCFPILLYKCNGLALFFFSILPETSKTSKLSIDLMSIVEDDISNWRLVVADRRNAERNKGLTYVCNIAVRPLSLRNRWRYCRSASAARTCHYRT